MKHETPLSPQGGFEQIVNDHADMLQETREKNRTDRKKRKYNRTLHWMEACLAGQVLALVLRFTGLLEPWVASVAATLLLAAICLMAGRLGEVSRK